jgi:hypothetical protein
VHAALVLEVRPDALGGVRRRSLDGELHILDAAQITRGLLDDLGLPLLALGVVQVHAKQVRREQRRLGTALAHLDLHDHVAAVVRVARDQESTKPLLGDRQVVGDAGNLFGEGRVLGSHLLGGREVAFELLPLAVRGDDATELRVATVHLLRPGRIRVQRRIGELLLQLVMLGQQCFN